NKHSIRRYPVHFWIPCSASSGVPLSTRFRHDSVTVLSAAGLLALRWTRRHVGCIPQPVTASVQSDATIGIDAHLVHVEVDTDRSLPSFTLVGLPDSAVRESRERVMASIRNAGFQWPRRRVTVSLAPADLRKERSAFDLAIAIGVLVASEQIRAETLADFALLVPAIDALSVNSRPHDAAKEFLLRHVDLEPLAASRAFVKKAESHGPLLT
ncbi:MAG: magnesium chelatase domain-containing protein, partial [Candidatus Latescibacterota bacterium]|nr:magnesium chelatase domain-containing protein [Candidatus Latescibacterota bacterium]